MSRAGNWTAALNSARRWFLSRPLRTRVWLVLGGGLAALLTIAAIAGPPEPDRVAIGSASTSTTQQPPSTTSPPTTRKRATTTTTVATTTTTSEPTTTSPPPTTAPPATRPSTTTLRRATPTTAVATTTTEPAGSCHSSYRECVPIADDVDCAGGSGNGPAYVSGPIHVVGPDVYDLDRDKDGVGCEP